MIHTAVSAPVLNANGMAARHEDIFIVAVGVWLPPRISRCSEEMRVMITILA